MGVKGVTVANVGVRTGDAADAVITSGKDVKVEDMIKAVEAEGYKAKEKKGS